MDYVFEVVDRTGRKIYLPTKQYAHMMKRHPYMHKYMEEIKETIRAPDKIMSQAEDVFYYYKSYKNLKKPNKFILVIVRYLNGKGFVITAYLEEKI